MLSSRTRDSRDTLPQAAVALAIVATVVVLLTRIAHAAADGAPPVAAPFDWSFWGGLAVALAAFASLVLHAVAAKTHNAKVEKLAAELDVLRGLLPARPAVTLAVATAQRDSQAGFTRLGCMISLAAAGLIALALAAPGCATGKAALADGAVAFLECEDGHLDAKELADFKAAASAELRHLFTGAAGPDVAGLKADLAPLESDLARCGWAAAVAAFGALLPTAAPGTAVSALVTVGPDPAQARAAFAVAARQLGWAPVRLADGTVL